MKLLVAGNASLLSEDYALLKSLGYEVVLSEREDTIKIENVSRFAEFDVVVCNWLFANHEISSFSNLKAIQLLSAGFERIPIEYVKEHNITVWNAKDVYNIPIAEFTVMTVLDVYKHSDFFYQNQSKCTWQKCRDIDELSDKTVCILGTGSIGTEVAKKFSVFVKQVIGINRHAHHASYEIEKSYFSKIIRFDEEAKAIISRSDIIIITLPLNQDTYHIFNTELLNTIKNDAILVNVGRGAVIDDFALHVAINNGKFRAVILDVFEREPLSEDYWGWKIDRVRIIPHNTFESKRNVERIRKKIMNNLKNFITERYSLQNLGGGGRDF